MSSVVLLCADGSDLSLRALQDGLHVLSPEVTPVVVTVVDEPDPTLVTGAGLAGGVMSAEEYNTQAAWMVENGRTLIEDTRQALGLPEAEGVILQGDAARAICDLAEERDAKAIVMGSRGRGGIKRAMLGSVSDHIVRHAPCSVVVTSAAAEE